MSFFYLGGGGGDGNEFHPNGRKITRRSAWLTLLLCGFRNLLLLSERDCHMVL